MPPQTVKAVEDVNRSKVNNRGPRHKAVTIATAVLILSGLSLFAGRYFLQDGNASTKITSEQQYENRNEAISQQHTIVVADSEAAGEMAGEETADMDLKPNINWGHLLSDISANIPTEMHLSIIESTDGSEMVLEGAALAASSAPRHTGATRHKRYCAPHTTSLVGLTRPVPPPILPSCASSS